jgi:hypothetical protein
MRLKISAAIATRGDVDLSRIRKELARHMEITEVIVETSPTPYGWFVAASKAANKIVYYQDDDCVTDIRPIIDAYEPGLIVNAMTETHAKIYSGQQTLIGFGTIFDKSLLAILEDWERDAIFLRESVRVFATLVPHKTVFPEIEILPCAYADNRLYRQVQEHAEAREAINLRIAEYKERKCHAV